MVRDPNKCILCGDCVKDVSKVQGIRVLDFLPGSKMTVTQPSGKKMAEVDCVNCGQCAAVCPTGALVVKADRRCVACSQDQPRLSSSRLPRRLGWLLARAWLGSGENTLGNSQLPWMMGF